MNQMQQKAPLWNRFWHARSVQAAAGAVAVLSTLVPGTARAQGGLDGIGGNMIKAVCEFIKSPIVTVCIGIAILALFLVMAMNEDNKMLSTILKIVIAGAAIAGLPGVLSILGFEMNC